MNSQPYFNVEYALSPIAIFTYKRLDTLVKAIKSLQKCGLASDSELYVFSDGPKKIEDQKEIDSVREYFKTITGFKKIHIKNSEKNKGLATSVISGVSEILEHYDKVIVLEDDLIVSTNFLMYMNQALRAYQEQPDVFSISGYTVPIKNRADYAYDNYFTLRGSSWGWGTWKNRWNEVDWEVKDYQEFANDSDKKRRFNQMGSDLTGMLAKQMNGDISSWAVRWCYHQFKINSFTVFPIVSKVNNIGFGEEATHTSEDNNRFATPIDISQKEDFIFNPSPQLDSYFTKQFTAKYSIPTRAYYKIKKIFNI